ncbi:MAG: hypothetical protein M3Y87_02760 [Myxococcota bacterium]|nr:hypothetical protein [Myxococcota bacterium]
MRDTSNDVNARPVLLLVAIAIAVTATLPASTAEAQRRPLYAGFGVGPFALFGHDGFYGPCCDVHFRAQGEFGWHPSGTDSGFFLAANLTITPGNDFFIFTPGLRLGGDIEVHSRRDVSVFLRPSVLLGAGFFDPDGPDNTLGLFVIQPAFDIRIALADHVVQLWVRPFAIDFLLFPEHWHDRRFRWHAGYTFMAGIDFAF